MKKVLFPLLALFLVFGCGGGGDDDGPPTTADMAGVYSLVKITVNLEGATVTFLPPQVSGSLNLTASGEYFLDVTMYGDRGVDAGSFAVSESTITLTSSDGSVVTGDILDDGRKVVLNISDEGATMKMEFDKS